MIGLELLILNSIASGSTSVKHPPISAISTKHPYATPPALGFIAEWADEVVRRGVTAENLPAPKITMVRLVGPDALAAALAGSPTISAEKSKQPPKSTVINPEDQLCSLNVADTELEKVLPLLTAQTGLNILLMSSSATKMTLHVEKMRLLDVMRHVCALTGMSYLNVGGAYVVATPDLLKTAYPKEWLVKNPPPPPPPQEPTPIPLPGDAMATQTFVANYVKTSELIDTLKKLFPKDLDVIGGPGTDNPILSNVDPSAKTGQSTSTVTDTGSSSPGATSNTSHTIVLHGKRSQVDAALDVAKSLDLPRRQVNISVTIHDISNDAAKNLGLTWNFSDLTLTASPNGTGIAPGHGAVAPITFDAAISALESKDVARLMASPNISVLDGEKAFVLIGDRINYPALTGYTSTNSPIFSVNTERVGIYLQVAASISTDGYITLTLYPQVSSITSYLTVNGASYPQVSSREAQTTLRVKSGETIVLGGLLQDDDTTSYDRVPILSQIPFFGELFKHRQKTHTKSQVIIAIKPVIATPSPQ